MFLGNIVSEKPINFNGLFYTTNDINTIDTEVPTLIIGWDFTKRIMSDKKLSILEKNIENNLFWTFSKREKRIDFEKDLKNFVKICINFIETTIKYQYINILIEKQKNIKKIIKKLTSEEICYIYILKNSFIYAYLGDKIIGVDLNMIDYLGINRKKIYRILFSNENKVIFSNDFLPDEIRENIFENQKIIPYLQFINNTNNNNNK